MHPLRLVCIAQKGMCGATMMRMLGVRKHLEQAAA